MAILAESVTKVSNRIANTDTPNFPISAQATTTKTDFRIARRVQTWPWHQSRQHLLEFRQRHRQVRSARRATASSVSASRGPRRFTAVKILGATGPRSVLLGVVRAEADRFRSRSAGDSACAADTGRLARRDEASAYATAQCIDSR